MRTTWRSPSIAARVSRPPAPGRKRSTAGMRTNSTSASSASAASTISGEAGPSVAESVPASAGPITRARLKLLASSALAGVSSSSGTSAGIRLVKPPKDSG